MDWKITLCEPDLGTEEIEAASHVLKSGWLTMGAVTEQFEKEFAKAIGVKHAVAVTNGTVALHLANLALGIGSGDEVICPALTFVATANATRYTGAKVVFADSISSGDLTVDPEDIEKKITSHTRAISVVHYGGFSCHMAKIVSVARRHNLSIIEDCAHAPLAKCDIGDGGEGFVGAIGDVGCFSFFSNKNMTTGEGGMVTTNRDDLYEKIKLLRSHGMTSLTYDRHQGHASGYDVVVLGYNYRIDELRSAIGLAQLKKLPLNNQKRREVFRWYAFALGSRANVIIPFVDANLEQAAPHIMSVIVKSDHEGTRNRLRNAGVQTSKHYELVPRFTLYRSAGDFKSKIDQIENLITLPMYPGLTREAVDQIIELF